MTAAGILRALAAAALPGLAAALAPLAPAQAQTQAQAVRVTAGEHADFTRVVLQSATGFAWSLAEDGADLRIALPGRALRADPDTVFARIPRTRLAALRIEGDSLVLTRPCACPATGFEDRPGIVVIDLRDGPPLPAAPPPAAAARPAAAPPAPGPTAGRALARRLAAAGPAAEAPAPVLADGPAPAPDPAAAIPAEIAAAMTRGLLPAPDPARPPQVLGPPVALTGVAALPPNLALRGADEAEPAPEPDPAAAARLAACPDPAALDALSTAPEQSFAEGLAARRAGLYGEFDQPDAARWLALATHYLQWGLGAEARQILDTEGLGIPHRDLLGGLADLIEGHASNRRARLAGHLGCPGPVAILGLLAAPPDQQAGAQRGAIVAGFQTLTPALREVLGPPLVRRLIAAGEIEHARMVREAVGRGLSDADGSGAVLDALLEQARGDLARAAARIATNPTEPDSLRLGLELALSRGEAWPESRLLDAAALAESLRSTDAGRAIGELVLRHHALAGQLEAGFALLDRFAGWAAPGPDHRARVADLRSVLWTAAAGRPDAEFLVLALGRDDWRAPDLDPTARAALAARFDALGLSGLAARIGGADAPPTQPLPGRDGPAPAPTGGADAPPGPGAPEDLPAGAATSAITAPPAPSAPDPVPPPIPPANPPAEPSAGPSTGPQPGQAPTAQGAQDPAPEVPGPVARTEAEPPPPAPPLAEPETVVATDAMAIGERRLAESAALRAALDELGLARR